MICPNCGNEDIAITEAYNKNLDFSLKFKVLTIGGFILGILFCLALFRVNATAGVITFLVFGSCYCIYLNYKIKARTRARRQSHSKCICKRCGYTWYLD